MSPTEYRVTIRGRLSEHFASFFDGLVVEPGHGETVLVGPVVDQGQLHGVLERIRDLGLELVRVEQVER